MVLTPVRLPPRPGETGDYTDPDRVGNGSEDDPDHRSSVLRRPR